MTPEEARQLPYRPCVGVVLTNPAGEIFVGQRADSTEPAWQMPQGGVDDGEAALRAAYRELEEETGVAERHVRYVQETADWHKYDLPLEIIPTRWNGRFRGQAQRWFQFELEAGDQVIDLNYKDREFSDWTWMSAAALLEVIVPFKRDVYRSVLQEFGL